MILFWTFNAWKIKLLGSTKSKITRNENSENVPYLEITEVHNIFRIFDVLPNFLFSSSEKKPVY